INLFINMFIGLSVGVSVLVSQYYGGKKEKDVNETVHTAICLATIFGAFLLVVGMIFARPILQIMNTPDDTINDATLYLKIYFLGVPAVLLYNYCNAVLRAVGDTKRPLIFLTIAGATNVTLNIALMYVVENKVAGVAIATIASHFISAILILRCLLKSDACYGFSFKTLKIYPNKMWQMIKIGVPASIQSCIFSFSNVIIQSTINSFGSVAVAANTMAHIVEGFTYTSMNSVSQTALAFTGQNIGAKKHENLKKILGWTSLYVAILGVVMGGLTYLLHPYLLRIFTDDMSVISLGGIRILYICVPYFLIGLCEVFVGMLRGIGHSIFPTVVSIVGICGVRLLWIFFVFPYIQTLESVYISYPISWFITGTVQFVALIIIIQQLLINKGTER
ncbi:MAG: MATE family efflux transporter, partial [Clostridia bacterium]|nr:MATE family efflux transporter [Clostridia bacterium]